MLELLGRVVLGVDGIIFVIELRELLRGVVRCCGRVERMCGLCIGSVRCVGERDGVLELPSR